MTLVLALANEKNAILIADRQVTPFNPAAGAQPPTAKIGLASFRDGRFAFGFTGIAHLGDFNTLHWILDTLHGQAAPDYLAPETIRRFTEEATKRWATLNTTKVLKRQSFLFVGHRIDDPTVDEPPRAYCFLVSNFDDFETELPEAEDKFRMWVQRERRPAPVDQPPVLLAAVGRTNTYAPIGIESLAAMLREKRPGTAILNKAIETMRDAAQDPMKTGISRDFTSVILNRDDPEALADYHVDEPSNLLHLPAQATLTGPPGQIIGEMWMGYEGAPGGPGTLVVPPVGRNKPCPCGSGRKYKKCHGRPENKGKVTFS